MSEEYRRSISLKSVDYESLDLSQISALLARDTGAGDETRFELDLAYISGRHVVINDLSSLHQEGLLSDVQSIEISVRGGASDSDHKYVSLSVQTGGTRLYVASPNGTWFDGKISQVTSYWDRFEREYTQGKLVEAGVQGFGPSAVGGDTAACETAGSREYRAFFDLGSVTLFKGDLCKVTAVLAEGIDNARMDISVRGKGEERQTHKSIISLSQTSLPSKVVGFKVDIHGDGVYVSLEVDTNTSKVYVHSTNEIWFRGKAGQLKELFRQHRRLLHVPSWGVGPLVVLCLVCIGYCAPLLFHKQVVYGISGIVASVSVGVMVLLGLRKGVIFTIERTQRGIHYEKWGFWVMVFTLLASIVIPLSSKSR